jgi:hypothetical protein
MPAPAAAWPAAMRRRLAASRVGVRRAALQRAGSRGVGAAGHRLAADPFQAGRHLLVRSYRGCRQVPHPAIVVVAQCRG